MRLHGWCGFGDRNETGEGILDFAIVFELIVTKTFFKKRKEHLITFRSKSNNNQVDYFFVKKLANFNM